MQTQLDMAKHMLFDQDALHVRNIKMYPGSSRDVTPEQMAAQINVAIASLMAGDYEDVTDCND